MAEQAFYAVFIFCINNFHIAAAVSCQFCTARAQICSADFSIYFNLGIAIRIKFFDISILIQLNGVIFIQCLADVEVIDVAGNADVFLFTKRYLLPPSSSVRKDSAIPPSLLLLKESFESSS